MKHNSVRRPATIIDVAARAGVSIKTVSRVLNEERYVLPAKREEVCAAVKALSYTPHPSARNLPRGSSRTIGLAYATVVGEPGSFIPHYSQGVQLGALDACQRADFGILLLPCRRDSATLPAEIVRRAKAHRVSGLVIAAPICNATGVAQALRTAGLPYTCINPDETEEGMPSVLVNDREAAREMARYILSQGHRRIAFARGSQYARGSSEARLAGYREAMAEAGIPVDPRWIAEGDHMFESGVACGRQLLNLSPRPTAIFASNDEMAVGIMHAAYARGLSLPQDLSVAGFDDSDLASHAIWPPLTTVHQPIQAMAGAASEQLIRLRLLPSAVNGAPAPALHQCFQCRLVIRESVAPVSRCLAPRP